MINNYTDFSMEEPGCAPGAPVYRAQFTLDCDISDLFPYINAVAENTKYFDNPQSIHFSLQGKDCVINSNKIIARLFEHREEAIEYFTVLKNFLNDIESKKDTISPDFNVHKYIPVFDILKRLPRTNCKECGFQTCTAFANAVSKGESAISECTGMEHA